MDDELPENVCPECDAIFSVVWRNDGIISGVEYCPFCGFENRTWQLLNGDDEQ